MSLASPPAPVTHGALRQFRRFAAVGLLSNLVLYGAYLGMTSLGATPKITMSVLYAIGVLSTYVANNLWSFGRQRLSGHTFSRYLCSQGLGYGMNLGLLWALVDQSGWPHQLVQALAIALVAVLLFGLNRYWVFAQPAGQAP